MLQQHGHAISKARRALPCEVAIGTTQFPSFCLCLKPTGGRHRGYSPALSISYRFPSFGKWTKVRYRKLYRVVRKFGSKHAKMERGRQSIRGQEALRKS